MPDCAEEGSEPIEAWRRYARQFNTILQLSEQLQEPRRSKDAAALWKALPIPPFVMRRNRDQSSQRRLLVSFVNAILSASTLQPILIWTKRPTIQFGCRGGTTLFSALAFKLALAVGRCSAAFCSYCHTAYEPSRRPRAGEANSCPDCRQLANAERVRRCRDLKRTSTHKRSRL